MSLDFNHYAQKGNEFLNELSQELSEPTDVYHAGRILRAVLHTFRNHITLEENFQLLAQLPMALKGVYVDGWAPQKQHVVGRRKIDFVAEVIREDMASAAIDFANVDEVVYAIATVLRTLRRYISEGEYHNIEAVLPRELKELVQDSVDFSM